MVTHRFQEFLTQTQPAARFAAPVAFVPCPMQTFSATQLSQIQEVYRLAAEMTREQMQPVRYPQFSMN